MSFGRVRGTPGAGADGATLPPATNGALNAPDGILTWLVGKGSGSEIRALAVTRD